MKRLLQAVAACCALALGPAFAADPPSAPRAPAAPGKAGAKAKPSLDRMHAAHKAKLNLECSACHTETQVDTLLIKTYAAMPVDRDTCLACHQAPGKPAWYGAARK